MSKIRYFSNGKYIYFKHCPFCGSVGVDFLGDKFRCPDCGAVVTFDLPKKDIICDGPTDSMRLLDQWNRRARKESTAEDLCVLAQKATEDNSISYQRYIADEVRSYIYKSATLSKFDCEIPKRYLKDVEEYQENGFDIKDNGDNYIVSWRKDIKWD